MRISSYPLSQILGEGKPYFMSHAKGCPNHARL
jgi:hypothetical protein